MKIKIVRSMRKRRRYKPVFSSLFIESIAGSVRNDNKLLRDVLRMTKDNLRAAKEDLSYERSERKRLEEQLQEKMAEIEKLRADKSVGSERCESNTVVKIVTTGPAMDSDTRRKMLEDIKNSLRYLPFNIT